MCAAHLLQPCWSTCYGYHNHSSISYICRAPFTCICCTPTGPAVPVLPLSLPCTCCLFLPSTCPPDFHAPCLVSHCCTPAATMPCTPAAGVCTCCPTPAASQVDRKTGAQLAAPLLYNAAMGDQAVAFAKVGSVFRVRHGAALACHMHAMMRPLHAECMPWRGISMSYMFQGVALMCQVRGMLRLCTAIHSYCPRRLRPFPTLPPSTQS